MRSVLLRATSTAREDRLFARPIQANGACEHELPSIQGHRRAFVLTRTADSFLRHVLHPQKTTRIVAGIWEGSPATKHPIKPVASSIRRPFCQREVFRLTVIETESVSPWPVIVIIPAIS